VAHPLEAVELAAFADPFAAAGERDGFVCRRLGGALCLLARQVPAAELNRVAGAGADTDLDAVAAFYAGVPHTVAVSPGEVELETGLHARGYRPGYAWMKFARAADPAVDAPTDLRLEVVPAARATDFAGPVVAGFGMPPLMLGVAAALPGRPGWTCLVGYDQHDRPVAAGALFVHEGVGWCGMGATLPAARGRGGQSAILAARIRLAAEQGCRTVTTETGVRRPDRAERSYRNILRAGFLEVFERPNLTSPPRAA